MRKSVALLLLAVLCLTALLIPQSAEASGYSGKLGEKLTWKMEEGTLTISGKGEMPNEDDLEYIPWNEPYIREDVKNIVIESDITSIMGNAFSGLHNVESVTIPDTVRTIGRYAFSECWSLKKIDLPDGITEIGEHAFEGCSSLTSFTVPAGVTKISWSMLSACAKLENIKLHEGITEIESYAFSRCFALTEVTIPNSVTVLGSSTFDSCENLKKVKLGNKLSVISNSAFSGCKSLTEIVIPDSVTSVEGNAFSHCDNLEKVTLGAGVMEISFDAFDNCPKLNALTVKKGNSYFLADKGALYARDTSSLLFILRGFTGEYTILPGTKKINEHAAHACAGLTGITIPDSVTEIGEYAFADCSALKYVTLSGGLAEIAGRAFAHCESIKEITIPGSVERISYLAFSGCSSLKKITFQGSMPVIQYTAFDGVEATVYYPENDPSYEGREGEMYEFSGYLTWKKTVCEKHTEVSVPGVPATCTETGLTEGTRCKNCGQPMKEQKTIPAAGHQFGEWKVVNAPTTEAAGLSERACKNCDHKETKTLDKVVEDKPASGSSGENLTWHYDSGVLTIKGSGPMFDYDKSNMPPWMDLRIFINKVIIEDGVTSISHKAFIDFTELTEVSLPGTVEIIGGQAFGWCGKLKTVTIPEGVKKIGDYCFTECTGLETVHIPASVTFIDLDAFFKCGALKEIYFYGDAPQLYGFGSAAVTVYYPAESTTWTEDVQKSLGNNLTWVAKYCMRGHTEMVDEAKPATCTEDGLTEGKHCTGCGEVFVAQKTVPASGHSWGDWHVIRESTMEVEGCEERACSACDFTEQRALEKLPATEPPTTESPVTEPSVLAPGVDGEKQPSGAWILLIFVVLCVGAIATVVLVKKKK